MKIDSKIKVFISSNCGSKEFVLLRSKIKTELERTKIINVYLFENRAKSLPTIPSYIMELEDSDVCVFLLEDKEIPDGVKKEIDRAKKTNKKSLYYFCGTKAKETAVLKHSLIESKKCVFNIVQSFDDFLKSADDLVNEIIQIYHYYCNGWMIDKESYNEQLSTPNTDNSISSKSVLKYSDRCKKILSNFLFADNLPINNTNDFDLYCSKFLEILLYQKSIRDFNLTLLLKSLKEQQTPEIFEITALRWQAIQQFFLGDKSGSVKYLEEALKLAKQHSINEWILKDILIDLRSLKIMIENENGRTCFRTDVQDELDASQSTLYYPVLDRYDKELYENFIEHDLKESLKSPFTITFGDNLNGLINNLTNTYLLSIFNGSLTHIRLIYKRLKDCAFYLCKSYSDWSFRLALCKTMVMEYNKKEFERMEILFKDILERINCDDAKEIFDFAFNLSTEYERKCAILTAFAHVGNYLNDDDFVLASECVFNILDQWLKDPNDFLGRYIFPSLYKNVSRMDGKKIFEFSTNALKAGYNRFLPELYKLLAYLDFAQYSREEIAELEEIILSYLKDKPDFSFSQIGYLLVKLKKQNLCSDLLLKVLKEKYPQKYNEIILLNTTKEPEELEGFITNYISEIDRRNKTQGVNGYIGYATNPYQIIESLVKDNAVLNEINAAKIVNSSLDTLIAKTQGIQDKIDAIRLIFAVINRYKFQQKFILSLREIIGGNLSDIFKCYTTFCNISLFALRYGFNLLMVRLGDAAHIKNLENQSLELATAETIDKITCVQLLSSYLDRLNFSTLDSELKYVIKNLILTARLSDSHEIVFYATVAILELLPYEKELVQEQLYNVMNNDNCYIKNIVIQQLPEIKKMDEYIYKNIVEKGLRDSNFFVRLNTKNIVNQIENTV